MAKKALRIKQAKHAEVLDAGLHALSSAVVGRVRSTASSGSAVSVCARMVHAGEIPGVTKASW